MNAIQEQITKLEPWFHNLHLPDGTQTFPNHPLGDFPFFKWKDIEGAIPKDLYGWTALDIGCNAGFYTFELGRRGATVTAIDIDEHYLSQARWAAPLYGLTSKITFQKKQLYELAKSDLKYDIVWFMGVMYHLRYPLLSLDIVRRITRKMMVFQCMSIPGTEVRSVPEDIGLSERAILNNTWWPKMAFIEHQIDGDPTNWWVPNKGGVMSLLRASGFRVVAEPADEIYICEIENDWITSDDLREQEYRAAIGL